MTETADLIPPDNRAAGQTGHIADHNDIADVLTALSASAVNSGTQLYTGTVGDGHQRLAIPSYIYPTWYYHGGPQDLWAVMQAAAPSLRFVIINPGSGSGSAINTDYVTQTALAQAAGLLVLGYVTTDYAVTSTKTAAQIEAEVDNYYNWYQVDGIFYDEVSSLVANQPYYLALYQYVKAKTTGQRIVVINPGTIPDVSYMAACDVLCNFEGDVGLYRVRQPAPWEVNYPANRFWHIVYACYTTAQRDEMLALSRAYRAGYIYLTPDVEPDPYNTLPSGAYWQGLITQVTQPYPVQAWAPVLEDGFDNNSAFIGAQWTVSGSPVLTGAQLVILGHSTFADYIVSAATFNFTTLTATIEALSVPAAASATALMRVQTSGSNFVAIGTSGPNLLCRVCLAGVNSDVTVTYNGTSMLWWSLALSPAGMVTWQTSPDGFTWTTQRTANTGIPALTAANLELIVGHTSTGDPDQSATFDNVLVV